MSLVNALLTAALATCLLALIALRQGAARARRDLHKLRASTSELRHLADHDPLTGLPNRRRFEQELARQLAHVRRYGPEGALLVLDLDCFKPVNDSLGHAAGDRLLTRVAAVLRERLRATDLIARLGGDEFAVLLPRVDRAGATVVARSLVETVRGAVPAAAAGAVTISVGVLAFGGDAPASTPESALAAADLAMYDAKAAGGDGFAFYAEPRVTAATAAPSAAAPAAPAHLPGVAVT
ncbi:MAG TPA: GGDEF domain-containing protein [Conexibacter sp.]|nr:GGDEF domain-containing protein [Conexibacter sp.]